MSGYSPFTDLFDPSGDCPACEEPDWLALTIEWECVVCSFVKITPTALQERARLNGTQRGMGLAG